MTWLSQCFQRDREVCKSHILPITMVLCSHLDALVGYFSRGWPICGITKVTNLVPKRKVLLVQEAAGVPCSREEHFPPITVPKTRGWRGTPTVHIYHPSPHQSRKPELIPNSCSQIYVHQNCNEAATTPASSQPLTKYSAPAAAAFGRKLPRIIHSITGTIP